MYEVNLSGIQSELGHIRGNLHDLAQALHSTNNNVSIVNQRVELLDAKLEALYNELKKFIESDKKAKELQLAETRLVKIRQELKNKYGYYEEVRKHINGILQAVDSGVVRKDTYTTITEELMLKTPGYWLTPCLIALAAWINNDKELAEKALDEAIKRDDEKTSLLFALINRRIGRYEASEVWLKRYFSMQDPKNLRREMIIVLDAYANGMFGGDAAGECSQKIEDWIKELSENNNFVVEQRENWKKALKAKQSKIDENSYKYLHDYCKEWNDIEKALNSVSLHENLLNYFKGIFEGEIDISPDLNIALDDLLRKLVSDFDHEELSLKKQENYLKAVIESHGDTELAFKKVELSEKVYEETLSFVQLLSNVSMLQNETNASKATQRLAIALSKNWIIEAYNDVTAEGRLNVPAKITINIENWTGITQDGSNEEQLIQDFYIHSEKRKEEELAKVKLNVTNYAKLGVGIILGAVLIKSISLALIPLSISGYLFYRDYQNINNLKIQIQEKYEQYKNLGTQIIKAALAEVVDFKRQYEKEDKKYETTKSYIAELSHKQFVYNKYGSSRNIIL